MLRLLSFWAVAAVCLTAASTDFDRALVLYQKTEYRAALDALISTPQKDGPTWELIGKAYFQSGDFKKATEAFEKAIAANPSKSEYYHWLGRTYGRRAETSMPLTAPGHASKARQNFEKAVQLDPNNKEAVNDLFEYYLQAPGFLGGGFEKAAALANRIRELDPVEYHFAEARLAEKRKEFPKAEQQLRRAAELAPREVGRIIDLAKFFAKHGRFSESDAAFKQAETIAPNDPQLLFERASVLIEANRNLNTARELLKRYLASPLTPGNPSRDEAKKLLKQAEGG